MDSDSSQYKAANEGIKKMNKHISGLNRVRKQMKLNQKVNDQNFIIERLRYVSDKMHEAGASEQSIRLALRGTYEFMKVTLHSPYSPKLNHNKSIGYGTDVYLLAKSLSWTVTLAWVNHYFPSSLPLV